MCKPTFSAEEVARLVLVASQADPNISGDPALKAVIYKCKSVVVETNGYVELPSGLRIVQ